MRVNVSKIHLVGSPPNPQDYRHLDGKEQVVIFQQRKERSPGHFHRGLGTLTWCFGTLEYRAECYFSKVRNKFPFNF